LLVAKWPDLNAEQLRLLAIAAREKLGRGLVVLGSSVGGKGSLVGVVSKDLVGEGISAAEVVAAGAKLLGGGGSRDPELAQAGGPHGDQLGAALEAAHEAAATRLNGV
jgi:alanyl-tRNA synthetase